VNESAIELAGVPFAAIAAPGAIDPLTSGWPIRFEN
jgi:hypothetical protein